MSLADLKNKFAGRKIKKPVLFAGVVALVGASMIVVLLMTGESGDDWTPSGPIPSLSVATPPTPAPVPAPDPSGTPLPGMPAPTGDVSAGSAPPKPPETIADKEDGAMPPSVTPAPTEDRMPWATPPHADARTPSRPAAPERPTPASRSTGSDIGDQVAALNEQILHQDLMNKLSEKKLREMELARDQAKAMQQMQQIVTPPVIETPAPPTGPEAPPAMTQVYLLSVYGHGANMFADVYYRGGRLTVQVGDELPTGDVVSHIGMHSIRVANAEGESIISLHSADLLDKEIASADTAAGHPQQGGGR